MTPDELRRIADERPEWAITNARRLALLCADLHEALMAIQTHTRFSEMPDGKQRIMQVAAALASFEALEKPQ